MYQGLLRWHVETTYIRVILPKVSTSPLPTLSQGFDVHFSGNLWPIFPHIFVYRALPLPFFLSLVLLNYSVLLLPGVFPMCWPSCTIIPIGNKHVVLLLLKHRCGCQAPLYLPCLHFGAGAAQKPILLLLVHLDTSKNYPSFSLSGLPAECMDNLNVPLISCITFLRWLCYNEHSKSCCCFFLMM